MVPYGNSNLTALASPSGGTFTWSVSDSSILTISSSAATATILGKRPGITDLTVTYTNGTLTASFTRQIIVSYPVILVHGISSGAIGWSNLIFALQSRGLLYDSDGFCRSSFSQYDFCALDFGTDPYVPEGNNGNFIIQGFRLSQAISSILSQVGADKVSLVAHSMGGLVSRAAIQLHSAGNSVSRLITIGTPHQGSAWPRLSGVSLLNVFSQALSLTGFVPPLTSAGAVAMNPSSQELRQLNVDYRDRLYGYPDITHVSIVARAPAQGTPLLQSIDAVCASFLPPLPVPPDCQILNQYRPEFVAMLQDGDLAVAARSQDILNVAPNLSRLTEPPLTLIHRNEITQVDIFLRYLNIP